jgi:hypothetical protein
MRQFLAFVVFFRLFVIGITKLGAGEHDKSISHYFGDVALSKETDGTAARKSVGFQFFLSNETDVFLLTCVNDLEYIKDRPHWKIVLKKCQLPSPSRLQSKAKPRSVPSFIGNFAVAYIDVNAVDSAQKGVLKLLTEINELNQKLNSDFSDNAIGLSDPMTRTTEMQISVSKNFVGKGSFVVGSYLGLSDSKRPAAFETYERVLFQLVKALE